MPYTLYFWNLLRGHGFSVLKGQNMAYIQKVL